MNNCRTRWYTVVDEMSVDELSWNRKRRTGNRPRRRVAQLGWSIIISLLYHRHILFRQIETSKMQKCKCLKFKFQGPQYKTCKSADETTLLRGK